MAETNVPTILEDLLADERIVFDPTNKRLTFNGNSVIGMSACADAWTLKGIDRGTYGGMTVQLVSEEIDFFDSRYHKSIFKYTLRVLGEYFESREVPIQSPYFMRTYPELMSKLTMVKEEID